MRLSQYENWRDFAMRMAQHADFGLRARPSRAWVVEVVASILADFERPDMHRAIVHWDYSKGDQCVGDYMDSWECDETPYFRGMFERREETRILIDENCLDACVNPHWIDHLVELATAQWQRQFWSPIACCIRAGLDMATSIGGGVLGFSMRDLRRMYPEGLPRFVTRHYSAKMHRVADHEGVWL